MILFKGIKGEGEKKEMVLLELMVLKVPERRIPGPKGDKGNTGPTGPLD